jgi:hypothetical protein
LWHQHQMSAFGPPFWWCLMQTRQGSTKPPCAPSPAFATGYRATVRRWGL